MIRTQRRKFCLAVFATTLVLLFATTTRAQSEPASPATNNAPPRLSVTGDVKSPLTLTLDELKQMPRKTIRVNNEHAQEDEVYEGVPLSALLKRAGAPAGPQIRGKVMTTYVLAQGADGYQVLFSLAELDSDFQDSQVLVADTFGGKPINNQLGPLRLVVPQDKRPARWVRMLQSIKVVSMNGS